MQIPLPSQGLGTPAEQMAELFAIIASLPQRIIKDATQYASPTGVSATIQTYAIPANTLRNVGDILRVTWMGHAANNVNSKSISTTIAGVTVSPAINLSTSGTFQFFERFDIVLRTPGPGAGSQFFHGVGSQSNGAVTAVTSQLSQALSFDPTQPLNIGTIVTVQTAAGDVIQDLFLAELIT